MRVLGVTGTNGKTTTTYLLEAIATAAGDRAGRDRHGRARASATACSPPRTPRPRRPSCRRCSPRCATTASTPSRWRCRRTRSTSTASTRRSFAAACFTNLTHDHLDYHGSVDAYFDAKARLFTPVFTRRAAINVDDEHGDELARRAAGARARSSRASRSTIATADVDARRSVELTPRRHVVRARRRARGRPVPVRTALVGSFNVANALAAATTALLAGFELDAIVAGLGAPIVVPGPDGADRRGPGLHGARRLRAHARRAATPVLGAARALVGAGRPADRRVRVRRRPRPREAPDDGRDRGRAPPTSRIVTTDNPRSEDPAAIVDDVLAGVPTTTARSSAMLDRRAAIRAALARRARRRRRGHRGQGPRDRADRRRPHRAVRRPRRRARRARSARA